MSQLVIRLSRIEVESMARICSGAANALAFADSGAAGPHPVFVRDLASDQLMVVAYDDVAGVTA